jgi:uncharacterized protein YegJ (DUF2314 family)
MIYFPENEAIDESAIESVVNKVLPGFHRVNAISGKLTSDEFQINMLKKGDEEFMELDVTLLSTFSQLTDQETIALQKANRAIEIVFHGSNEDISEKQHNINQLVYDITDNKNVIIVDVSTFEFFNIPLWKQSRLDPFKEEPLNVTSQVTIHTYREGAFCRAVTLGMNKFCLPEISIKNFTCSSQNSFGNLINATIQTLFENPFINSDSTLNIDLRTIKNTPLREYLLSTSEESASHFINIKLKHVEREEGDNYGPQLLIAFENTDYSSPQEEANQVVATLFGTEDSLVYTNHDEELLKASERAKEKFPQLKQLFNDGLGPGYSLMVKIPFETDDGGNEWMWVEVTKWDKSEMEGILQNDPYEITNLKAGALVEFDESDIFDYLLNKPDGTFEGNETGKILEGRAE